MARWASMTVGRAGKPWTWLLTSIHRSVIPPGSPSPQPGAIDYVCKDGISVTLRLGGFLYAHLLDDPSSARAGRYFAQGEELGQLKAGSFSSMCGYAYQPSGWAHLHWAFPSGDLLVENWTLQHVQRSLDKRGCHSRPRERLDHSSQNGSGRHPALRRCARSGKEWMEPWIEAYYYDGITTGCGASPLSTVRTTT